MRPAKSTAVQDQVVRQDVINWKTTEGAVQADNGSPLSQYANMTADRHGDDRRDRRSPRRGGASVGDSARESR